MISKHYRYTFAFLRPLFRLYNRVALGLQPVHDPKLARGQSAIIMANHVNNLDPFYLASGIRRPVFYVASDHIFRLGFVSKIISWMVAPIPIVKSHIDLRTMRTIHSLIKDGAVIGLFPEGNRNFNGQSGSIPASTGKLVRQLKSTVLIYRIRGGYLTSPRWSRHSRKGRLTVELARRIEPEELASLTPEEINRIIETETHVDAYADQRSQPVRYRGKRLAEYLERAIFVCPKCHGLATLTSQDDRFSCTCGLDVRFNDLGFFEPVDTWSAQQLADGSFLETVSAWDIWQRDILTKLIKQQENIDLTGQRAIFTDEQENLVDCQRAERSVLLDHGSFALYADRFEFCGPVIGTRVFPLEKLDRVIVLGTQTLQFSETGGQVYELRSKKARSAYKYVILYYSLMQRIKGESYGFFGF
ncbi:MAG TPA: hypothetical protein DCM45_07255 [Clostridiales bacterium]|nr:hypothetical protein [Clostridiales bacterium]